MPALSGSDKAYQFALSGVCRSGASRSDYYRPVGQVSIGGTLRSGMVDRNRLKIIDTMTAQANTCRFECFDFTPLRGQEVIVSIGTLSNRLFAGHIINVSQSAPHAGQRVRFAVDCVDYTWLLDARRITGKRYIGESVTNIVNDLMTSFAPSGFTTGNVEASMDAVDFTANHAETLMQALARLMKMATKSGRKGGYCKVDYNKGLHAFVTPETTNNPTALTPTNTAFWDLQYAIDISQVRTRTYALGATTQTTSTVPSGATAVPVEDTRQFVGGSYALAFGNQISYAGTSPTSGPGWLTGVTSFAYAVPQGESIRLLAIGVNSTAAQSMAAILGGDGLIDHVIEDERLGASGAQSRADADVGLYFAPEERVGYTTRDKFAFAGKTLPVSLTAPTTIAAELVVQQVEISDISLGNGLRFPVRRVDAAKTFRDGFELLAVADQLSTEGVA